MKRDAYDVVGLNEYSVTHTNTNTHTHTHTLMEETCMVLYLHSRKQPTINNVMLNVSRETTVNKASSATIISVRKQIISELQQTFVINGKIS